jgi:glycosyltransferase involved in cell wall biosynthesis
VEWLEKNVKLIIQIPCHNEEQTLPITLANLPKSIPGVDAIETLIIDDGSTDRTVEVAQAHKVNHIVQLTNQMGLARAFMAGIDASLKLGADIIVNTDGDNQYNGQDVVLLVQPILEKTAHMVIGDRNTDSIPHFSPFKKRLQKIGSWVVRQLSNTNIPDVTSGFRAYSKDAALQLNVVSNFSYTLETIILAGNKNIAMTYVPVRTNPKLRESRLFSSIANYLTRSGSTMIRVYTMYRPLKVFTILGLVLLGSGFFLSLRFIISFIEDPTISRHIQSLTVALSLSVIGFVTLLMGMMTDLISANRRLIEETLYRIKKMELELLQKKKEKKVDQRKRNTRSQ